jgi:WD repeat-containing protein 61
LNKANPNITVTKLREYTGHKGSIYGMALSQDEKYLFTSGDDGIVAQWALDSEENHAQAVLQTDRGVYALEVLPGNRLAVGNSGGLIYIVNLGDQSIHKTLQQSTAAIFGIKVIRDHLWILHGEGFLSILKLSDFSQVLYKRIAQNHLRSICFSEEENIVYIGTSDYQILALAPHPLSLITRWQAHENSVFSLAIHQETKRLLSGGRDAYLNIWDIERDYESVQKIPAHNFTINNIAFSPSKEYFATAGRDKTIKLWDARHFDLLKVIDFARNTAHTHSVNKIRWLKSDNSLISCSDDRRIIRWKIEIHPKH